MIELPEAVVLAGQVTRTLTEKRIQQVIADHSPHKFAWYTGDPAAYPSLLEGKTIRSANPVGGTVEIVAGDHALMISTPLRYHPAGEAHPKKHQLLLIFEDGSALSATIQGWGCLLCYPDGSPAGLRDYILAKNRPSPYSDAFDRAYFDSLLSEQTLKLPAKAFLATEQRIPGLGNGVLQDFLWTAGVHPRKKMSELSPADLDRLYAALKEVLSRMAEYGGRDTEQDLYGCAGGYRTAMSKNTVGTPCPQCGTDIRKEAYMGGSIYYCATCQLL